MMKKTGLIAVLCAAASWFGVTAQAQQQPPQPEFVPGEVLIQFDLNARNEHLADALARAGAHVKQHVKAGWEGLVLAATRLPTAQAIAALQHHPAVKSAEPNWIYKHTAIANDTYFESGQLWGMYGPTTVPANTYGSQAAQAWAAGRTGSEEVVVGIIDEGVNWEHPDLIANVWTNPGEIGITTVTTVDESGVEQLIEVDKATNGVDDDGNGKVDDIHGWNFIGDSSSESGVVYNPTDGDDHGTHVAGTICGAGNNGIGVAGVAWNVKFISAKFLGANGGTTVDAVEAVAYMTDLKKNRGVNIVALNNSWGGGGYSASLHTAIKEAARQNILFIAAAGNNGLNNDMWASYPSNYDTRTTQDGTPAVDYDAVIAVAALDSAGRKPNWSNYGARNVDLAAPGVGIVSTLPGGYGSYSGTSMATPHVTGATALYVSSRLNASAAEIRQAIIEAAKATPTKSVDRKVATGGRLNASSF